MQKIELKLLRAQMREALQLESGVLGFHPVSNSFQLKSEGDFVVWVGLNEGVFDKWIRINPFVGLHCVPVMKLCVDLRGEKYSRGLATVATHLGEVVPEVAEIIFRIGVDVEHEAHRLAGLVAKVGIPFAARQSSYRALISELSKRIGGFGPYPERLAAALFVSGERSAASEFVERHRATLRSEDPVFQADFEKFARPFVSLLEE